MAKMAHHHNIQVSTHGKKKKEVEGKQLFKKEYWTHHFYFLLELNLMSILNCNITGEWSLLLGGHVPS